ncbi:hypothetical protein Tco_1053417, partial [Tanacetum coccineum]
GPVVQGEGSTHQQEFVVPRPTSPTHTHVTDEAASTGVDVRYGGIATTVIGLEAGQGSGNIDKTHTMPQDSPLPKVNTFESDEGSLILQKLTFLCTTLSKKMESLEIDLKQTKLTYGVAYTKFIKKVKNLENKVKSNQARRRARIVVSDDEDSEDPSKQGRKIYEINQDPKILLVQHDAEIQGRQEHDMEFEFDLDAAKDVSTAEEDISTAMPVSTAGSTVTTASVDVSTATISTAKDKAALRLQVELEEEERQRIASVQEAASSFNIKEWDDIQARVEADEELACRGKREHIGAYTLQQLRSYSFDEIKNLFETTMRRVHTFVLMDSEIERAIPESTSGSSK